MKNNPKATSRPCQWRRYSSSPQTLLTATALLAACGVVPSGQTPGNSLDGFGLLRVEMHDAPIIVDGHEVSAIDVSVVEVHGRLDGEWIKLEAGGQPYNLLDLVEDFSVVIGDAAVPTGTYNEIRLVLAEDPTITVDGEVLPLRTPSASKSGLKIKGDFVVSPNLILNVTLDFDAGKSVRVNNKGEWSLHPVIRVDGVDPHEGLFAAKEIDATGGTLELDDGLRLEIPPGAVPAPTLIWVEKSVETAQGYTLSSLYDFGPDGLEFEVPATVTVPYDEGAIPVGVPEDELEVLADFERLGSSDQDLQSNLVSAQLEHFTTVFVALNLNVDLAVSFVEDVHDGVTIYNHLQDSVPWVVAVVDPRRTDLRIRGLIAPVSAKNGEGTQDDVYELMNIEEIAGANGSQPLFAMNSIEWQPVIDNETGIPARTVRIAGSTLFDLPDVENYFSVSDNASGIGSTTVEIGQQATFRDTVFGSRTSVVTDGEFKNPAGVYYKWPYGDQYGLELARTAVGVDDDGNLVMLLIGGTFGRGANLPGVFNKLRDFDVVDGVLMDGGGSPQVMIKDELQKSLLLGVYYNKYEEFNGHRPVISSLVVEPKSNEVNVVDDTDESRYLLFGNPNYWHDSWNGYAGHSLYTGSMNNLGEQDNTAEILFDIVEPGMYAVDAFIPSTHATTTSARYTVIHGEGETSMSVNQLGCSNGWVRLGEFFFPGGGGFGARLTDVTGEPYLSTEVGYDAFRFLPADDAPGPDCGWASDALALPEIDSLDYRLPYPGGLKYLVTQGVGGHEYTPKSYWGIDFGLAKGDPVVASAGGVVTEVVEGFGPGGCNSAYANKGNRVVLAHPDGSATLYLHLLRDSVPEDVFEGAIVAQGQVIGEAGNSGYVCSQLGDGTHLHFQRQAQGSWYTDSLRIDFVELQGAQPAGGITYQSQNW